MVCISVFVGVSLRFISSAIFVYIESSLLIYLPSIDILGDMFFYCRYDNY